LLFDDDNAAAVAAGHGGGGGPRGNGTVLLVYMYVGSALIATNRRSSTQTDFSEERQVTSVKGGVLRLSGGHRRWNSTGMERLAVEFHRDGATGGGIPQGWSDWRWNFTTHAVNFHFGGR